MGYLDIANVVKKNGNEWIGYANPRHYKDWDQVDPMVLFIEGIHQFCVKTVKKTIPEKINMQLVPVQLKNIQINEISQNAIFKVTGRLSSIDNVLTVDFTASRRGLLASGTVVVSELKGKSA